METDSIGIENRPRLVEGGKGLVATRIGKSFKKRPVVRSVSLSVRRGEVVGLLGPNGAGKTTCFYMISGLIRADTGSIEIDGHDVTALPMYRRARMGIGYLPQEASIFRGLTAEQNIRASAELIEPDPARLEAAVEALLAEFGIATIAAGHCTGWHAMTALANAFGSALVPTAVGKQFTF